MTENTIGLAVDNKSYGQSREAWLAWCYYRLAFVFVSNYIGLELAPSRLCSALSKVFGTIKLSAWRGAFELRRKRHTQR